MVVLQRRNDCTSLLLLLILLLQLLRILIIVTIVGQLAVEWRGLVRLVCHLFAVDVVVVRQFSWLKYFHQTKILSSISQIGVITL